MEAGQRNKKTSVYWKAVLVFTLLFIVTSQFSYFLLPSPFAVGKAVFEPIAQSISSWIGLSDGSITELTSDSVTAYVNIFVIIFLSIIIAWSWEKLFEVNQLKLKSMATIVVAYFLAFILLRYGFNKMFKWQFFKPEPNIMYTRVGNLSPDILFWTSVGSSWVYSFVLGMVEVIAGTLLLFRKTRLAGAIFSTGIFFHILIINISFDISVKLYSSVFLIMSIVLIGPQLKALYQILVQKKVIPIPDTSYTWIRPNRKLIIKSVVVILIMIESLFIYMDTGNWNDDSAARPPMHGAYEVVGNKDWKRVFVHRRGYLIFEDADNKMVDFRLQLDTDKNQLVLHDYRENRSQHFNFLEVNGKLAEISNENVQIALKPLEYEQMKLLKGGFHWTIDH